MSLRINKLKYKLILRSTQPSDKVCVLNIMPVPSIFSFFHNVFYPIKEECISSAILKLSSANSYNLDKANILLSSRGLSLTRQSKSVGFTWYTLCTTFPRWNINHFT